MKGLFADHGWGFVAVLVCLLCLVGLVPEVAAQSPPTRAFGYTLSAPATAVTFLQPAGPPAVAVNPTVLEFLPSDDHSRLGLDGQPMVTRYELRMFLERDQATPVSTADIGKPVPDSDGKIRVANPVWFAGLTPNTRYVARVVAIGPSGQGASDLSNPFGNAGPPAGPTAVAVIRR